MLRLQSSLVLSRCVPVFLHSFDHFPTTTYRWTYVAEFVQPSAHSLHKTSACSRTVWVAFSCLSGGYPYLRKIRSLANLINSSMTWAASIETSQGWFVRGWFRSYSPCFIRSCRGNPPWLPISIHLQIRIFPVQFPFHRIDDDVFADAVQFVFIANDMFIIISLPQFAGIWRPTVFFHTVRISFCGHGFESVNDIRQ